MPPKFEAPKYFSPGHPANEACGGHFRAQPMHTAWAITLRKLKKIYGFNYKCLLNYYCFKFLEKLPQNYQLPDQPLWMSI